MTILEIALYDETKRVAVEHLNLIKNIILVAAQKLELEENAEVSITIVDNSKIHEINKEYRSVDRPTDVISFAIEDNDDNYLENFFNTEAGENEIEIPRLLGDIFISIDRAEEQAEAFGHSLERELGFLSVHGFLHLNGYDHQTDEEEKVMNDLQEKILKENNLER